MRVRPGIRQKWKGAGCIYATWRRRRLADGILNQVHYSSSSHSLEDNVLCSVFV